MKVDIFVNIKHITTNIKQHLNLTDFTIVRAFELSSQAGKSSSKAACEGICSSSFATYSLKNSLTNSISSTQDKARNVWWQTFLPRSIVLLGSNSSFRDNASLWSLVIESNQLEKGVGTKKFLYFSFLRQEKICLMRYSRQALFPPSTRATLKSFGDVFAKSCYQCRSKRDGTFGIASAGFQVIRQHCKDSLLKEQRICLLLI